MQGHRYLSFRESCLKLIDARLFPGLFQSDYEAIPFPLGSILRPKCLRDSKKFVSIGFASHAEALDRKKDLGDMILGRRSRDLVIGARLKTIAQILQLLANCVDSRDIEIASSSGCSDFDGSFDETGCE